MKAASMMHGARPSAMPLAEDGENPLAGKGFEAMDFFLFEGCFFLAVQEAQNQMVNEGSWA
jgi:hypothetical protein